MQWEKPIPIQFAKEVTFPLDVFPTWVSDFVSGIVNELSVSDDVPANLVISALSTLITKKFHFLYEETNWRLDLNTYIIIASPPGTKKDAVLKRVFAEIYQYQSQLEQEFEDKFPRIKSQVMNMEKRLEKASDLYAKNTDEKYQKECEEIIRKLEGLKAKLYKPTCVIGGDATPESIISLLSKNNEYMSIITAEGSELFSYFNGKYKNNSIEFYLKCWEGSPYTLYRVGREDELLSNPLLTIGLLTQPVELKKLRGFEGRGLVERFLYSVPKVNSVLRLGVGIVDEVRDLYNLNLRRIIANGSNLEQGVIKVSQNAKERFNELYETINKEMLDDNYSDSFKEWLAKVYGNLIKIVSLIRVANELEYKETIDKNLELYERDLSNLEKLYKYYKSHALKSYGIVRGGHRRSDLKYLLKRILDLKNGNSVNSTVLSNGTKKFLAPERNQLLSELEDHNLIKVFNQGRKKTIFINPEIEKMHLKEFALLMDAQEDSKLI
ncbi:hypothetical protein GCM10011391_38810 [Pullulanibacillus camelliae]|uniref:DUF3987 domain-containing protein n=1 Tax=Pullulanibacillus camelliae TaxID=1707096 RepID=A0A8J2YNR1_9BACL|nr:DUF3987 domain-containing protein [Pullulanibacillus camelliae]GGE56042.1 hypothetical protein GCM10011391_38810 [Pullulanibacillus camelliae]